MWLLAQVAAEMVEAPVPVLDPWTIFFAQLFASITTLVYFAFFLWMVIHCLRYEPDRGMWLWIMIIAQGIGPVVYFLVRYLPAQEFPAPPFMRRWTRRRQLDRLETAAMQIGNAYHYVEWGDALRDVRRLDEANTAYAQALKKEPDNIQALWGSALVATHQKRFNDVLPFTQRVLDKDPQYKFGDVSLAHGRALIEVGNTTEARAHLEKHVRRWRHPEGLYLLAEQCYEQGDVGEARRYATELIHDVNGSPTAIARKFGRWKSLAKKLLRKLPK